jgi:hypothetical protein
VPVEGGGVMGAAMVRRTDAQLAAVKATFETIKVVGN